jgi:Polyketide cyclase / dehydrase and lipid transport
MPDGGNSRLLIAATMVCIGVTEESMSVTATVNAAADVVFDVLADPSTHEAIDGTGWVRQPLDGKRLTEVGQVFRMAMYHENHPDKDYEMANRVEVFDPPRAIAWLPGQGPDDANLEFGGWVWRYDLRPAGPSQTEVTLTYDWSRVPPHLREHIGFPPFDAQHLENSLKHLAQLTEAR